MCRVKLTLVTDDWYQSLEWYQRVDPQHCLLAAVVVDHQTHRFLVPGEEERWKKWTLMSTYWMRKKVAAGGIFKSWIPTKVSFF